MVTLVLVFGMLAVVRIYTNFFAEMDADTYFVGLAVWSAWLGMEGWRMAALPQPCLIDAPADVGETSDRDWMSMGVEWHARLRDAGWWREPELTLAGLARHLGTNTLYLSRAINDGLGMNFNEMVNRLRAEEVARLIDTGAATNLLPTALDAGFRSKATFNRAFRTVFGVSPSAYRQRLKS